MPFARDCCLPTCCTELMSVMLAGRGCRHHGGWAKALRKQEGADTALLALHSVWAWRTGNQEMGMEGDANVAPVPTATAAAPRRTTVPMGRRTCISQRPKIPRFAPGLPLWARSSKPGSSGPPAARRGVCGSFLWL